MPYSKKLLLPILLILLSSCSNREKGNSNISRSTDADGIEAENDRSSKETNSGDFNCRFGDGTHRATVDYTNPEMGYSQTYTLDVEVQNCEVIQISFANNGWLDSDHISSAEIEDGGSCTIEGGNGKIYEIQINQ